MVRLRVLLIFSLCLFYPKYYYYYLRHSLSLQTRELDRSFLPSYQATMAHPPPRGVVHANVGQKLLFCYLVRVF